MLTKLFRGLFKDRKGATALIVAVSLVPIMVASITAVDMARIAAARTVLQAAVDSAATAGAGALGTSQAALTGIAAAQSSYAGGTATLGGMTLTLTPSNSPTLVTAYCQTGTNVTCPSGLVQDGTGSCPSAYHYCLVVQAQLTLSNLLLQWITPTSLLGAKAVGIVGVATVNVNAGNFTSTSVGSAYDTNNILAYVVPSDSSGHTDFGTTPAVNSACTTGVIAGSTSKVSVPSGTGCNYELIGSSSSTATQTSGELTFTNGQYIAFAFANLSGATTSFGADSDLQYYTNLTVGKLSYPSGACVYNKTVYDISKPQCSSTNATKLYGECPAHNLYGSITQGTSSSLTYNGATYDDSLTIYSSANEMLGFPPTHNVNHLLPAFTATITVSNQSVSVQCPAWPTTTAAATNDKYKLSIPYNTNITAYATYYPDSSLATNGASVYPPNLQSACSPAASYPASGNNSYPNQAWWGWSSSNVASGKCGNQPTISNSSVLDPTYNNCALIVQPLGLSGTNVPTSNGSPVLPSYYLVVRATNSSTAPVVLFDPVYDQTTFQDLYPGVIADTLNKNDSNISVTMTTDSNGNVTSSTVTDKDLTQIVDPTTKKVTQPGYYPTNTNPISYKITAGAYAGYFAFIERPAVNDAQAYFAVLPPETSARCYNPQQNGYKASLFTTTDKLNPSYNATLLNNDNGSAVDPIANPQLGAIDCTANQNQSFGLYWNDMGGHNDDTIIYWNAVTVFTCPTPTYSTGVLAPATLSG